MTRSLRFLLYSSRFHLLGLGCGFLLTTGVLLWLVSRESVWAQYLNALPMLLELMVLFLASSLGSSGCPMAIAFGGRRRELFWAIQGCALVYGAAAALLCGAAAGLSQSLGQSTSALWPIQSLLTALFYLASCWVLAVLGSLSGLLLNRSRLLAAAAYIICIVLSIAFCLGQMILLPERINLWGSLPWILPLALLLLGLAGEGILHGLLARLCVR